MAEKKGKGKIAALVEEIISETVKDLGYLLWDVDYYKEGADYNLLVTIEEPEGKRPIDLEDCEKVSRAISPLLDEKDPIEDFYYLEVSSAGLERELTRPEHFDWYRNTAVSVRLYAPFKGKKQWQGVLISYEDGVLVLQTEEERMEWKKEEIAKVTTIDEAL